MAKGAETFLYKLSASGRVIRSYSKYSLDLDWICYLLDLFNIWILRWCSFSSNNELLKVAPLFLFSPSFFILWDFGILRGEKMRCWDATLPGWCMYGNWVHEWSSIWWFFKFSKILNYMKEPIRVPYPIRLREWEVLYHLAYPYDRHQWTGRGLGNATSFIQGKKKPREVSSSKP